MEKTVKAVNKAVKIFFNITLLSGPLVSMRNLHNFTGMIDGCARFYAFFGTNDL